MSSAFALPYHCNRMWQPIGSTFPTSHAPFPFALDVAVSSNAVKVRFVEVSSPSRNLTDIMFCYAESHRTSVCNSAIHPTSRNRFSHHTPRRRGILPRIGDEALNYNTSSFNCVSPTSYNRMLSDAASLKRKNLYSKVRQRR